jgi:hypothetical protein
MSRAAVDQQYALDTRRGVDLGMFVARVRGVAQAHRALLAGEEGGEESLEAAFVDVAAVAGALADQSAQKREARREAMPG